MTLWRRLWVAPDAGIRPICSKAVPPPESTAEMALIVPAELAVRLSW